MSEDIQQSGLWPMAVCQKCGEDRYLDDFLRNPAGSPEPYNLVRCRDCRAVYNEKQRLSRIARRDEVNEQLRLRNLENKEARERWAEEQAQKEEQAKPEYELLKVCVNCGKEKVATAFKLLYRVKDGFGTRERAHECEECANIIALQKADYKRALEEQIAERARTENSIHLDWEERRKAKHRKGYDTHLRARYGKTIEEYEAMLKAQEGKCAICRKNPTEFNEILFVDHSHVTGTVRGLLCQACNFGLGWFQDNRESMQIASEYLRHWDEWQA